MKSIASAMIVPDPLRQMPQNTPASQTARSAHRTRTCLSIAALLLLTILLRIPGIERPLVGHYATKSAMYAMMARNWALGRAPFWLPTTDCLAGGERGWHLLEIPLAAYLAGVGWAVCGGPLDLWGRAVSMVFSAAAAVLLYLLVRRWHSNRAAWVAAFVFIFSPASIIFGQSFMLEPSVVFLMLATLWCMENWLAGVPECHGFDNQHRQCIRLGPTCSRPQRNLWFALATMSLAALLCSKIYMIVMLLPLAARAGREFKELPTVPRRRWSFACSAMLAIGVLPALVWCLMVLWLASPDNVLSSRVFDSIRRSGAVHPVPSPMLARPDFYWRLLGNLWGVGLTPVGAALAVLGVCSRSSRRHLSWLAAMALLVAMLPGKFFELHYYTLILVPAFSVLAGIGWDELAGWLTARAIAQPPRFVVRNRGILHAAVFETNRGGWGRAAGSASSPLDARPRRCPGSATTGASAGRRRALVVARSLSASFCPSHRNQKRLIAACVQYSKVLVAAAGLLAGMGCSLRLAIGPAFITPPEDRAVLSAAAAVRDLSAEGELVATLHGAGPDLLYYCDRPGWALSANDRRLLQTIDRCRRQGAGWLVVADFAAIEVNPAAKAALETLPLVRQGDDYRVYRLVAAATRLCSRQWRAARGSAAHSGRRACARNTGNRPRASGG
ncbi:MAG: hypothetical protein B7Z73_00610 [Planctomycetia bacterium 21-64-5]|nr:MAG: hypothetical protein B7Z73_00610 [Planctomycetia bacterium 21-64-5]HQU41234.1 phospholipid carrier-dependent glycosyltransferase [Pirellulales bacterium]